MSEHQLEKQTRKELEVRVRQIIDALPHRAAIREGDVNYWISQVVGEHGELAIWHARRAGGFGGSQIGALVRNYLGQRADHGASAHDIVEGTLLRRVPEEPTGHMRRGIAMESEHRLWFYRKYGAVRNESAFKTLSGGVGPRLWMRYSPDEVANMVDPRGNGNQTGVWLGDYKAPSQVDHSSGVAFQYVCQLHMGRMVCEQNGVHIDGMILSQFDWQNWDTKEDVIDHNPELDPLIMAAGDHFWSFVERGEVPRYVNKPRLGDASDLVQEIAHDAHRLSRLQAIGSELDKKIEEIKSDLVEVVSKHRFGSSKLNVKGCLSVSAVQQFDPEKLRMVLSPEVVAGLPLKARSSSAYDEKLLLERVKASLAPGEKMSAFYAPGKFESDPLYEALLAHGLDADAFMTEQIRVSVEDSVKKEGQIFVSREFAPLLISASDAAKAEEIDRGVEGDVRHAPRSVAA